jgi:hypothetical protein
MKNNDGKDIHDEKPPIHWIESPEGVFEVYANLAHITWSLDDLRIRLAQLVPSPETRDPGDEYTAIAEERAAITLTWRNAKIFRDQLSDVIKRFEDDNWEIQTKVKLPRSG